MRMCPKCGASFSDDAAICPNDGAPLDLATESAAEQPAEATGSSSPTPDCDAKKPGTIIGNYCLLQLVGQGGMGRVYLAEHTRLQRKVAIKILRAEFASSPSSVQRFFNEARAVNQINHENIVEITDFVEGDGGETYCIMEFLRGRSLAALLVQENLLLVPRALGIALQICRALAVVHRAGIVHRDLKPGNVFLIERGGQQDYVKLLDFGVAKLGDLSETEATQQTAAGTIIGTPEFMSPEQASGRSIDQRTDIYALGVMLYQMVTGAKPFTGKSFGELLVKHLTLVPPAPRTISTAPLPAALDALIMQCLAKNPADRPSSMDALADLLRAVSDQAAVPVEFFAAPVVRTHGSWRRVVTMAALGAAALLALITALLARGDWRSVPAKGGGAVDAAIAAAMQLGSTVAIALDSMPRGARVFRLDDGTLLGETPLRISLPRSGAPLQAEFRLAGYRDLRRVVALDHDSEEIVRLTEAGDLDRDVTIDPFSKRK